MTHELNPALQSDSLPTELWGKLHLLEWLQLKKTDYTTHHTDAEKPESQHPAGGTTTLENRFGNVLKS